MRGRKQPAKKNKAATKKSNQSQNTKHQKLQAQLKKVSESRRELQQKLSALGAEWKQKIKQIEDEAFEKARSAFEKAHLKREDARQKVISLAVAKFDKHYDRKSPKKRTTSKVRRQTQPKKARQSKSSARKKVSA